MSVFSFPEKTAVILIGIQTCGKTTFYERYFLGQGYVHVNLDTLKTRNREAQTLAECRLNGQSFVVDNTNPTKADRARYIHPAKADGYRVVGCYFRSSVSESVKRNEARDRHVPVIAIAHTSNVLEMPTREEGFDELWYISIGQDGAFNIAEWREEK